MGKDKIGMDRINARLGASDIARAERSAQAGTRSAGSQSEDEGSGGNLLFIAALALVIAGGAGAFIARSLGGPGAILTAVLAPEPTYRSRVADVCESGWADDRENRDQIHCYMTRDIARLCDPKEKQALLAKISDYQSAAARADTRLAGAVLTQAFNPNVFAMGIAEAKSHDPNLTEEQREAQLTKTMNLAQDYMAPANKVLQESVNETKPAQLAVDVTALAIHGYLQPMDFSSDGPEFVREGVAAAGTIPAAKCGG